MRGMNKNYYLSKNFGKEWFWNNSFSIILIFNYLSLLNVAWTFSPWDASGKDVEMYPPLSPNLGDY